MKTYTIEQIRKYIMSQDSLGDVLYNLKNIDEFIVSKEVVEIEDADELNDYFVDLEEHQGESFRYEGTTYRVSEDVTSFIRDYGFDTFSQLRSRMSELLQTGLIEEA